MGRWASNILKKKFKQNNAGRYFLTLFPNGEHLLVANKITTVTKGQGLNISHVSDCLNHPDKHYTHRGYKFIWMDRRIKKERTAYRHALKYVKKMK